MNDITIRGASERQKSAIRHLCASLEEPVPNVDMMSYRIATDEIVRLSVLYRDKHLIRTTVTPVKRFDEEDDE